MQIIVLVHPDFVPPVSRDGADPAHLEVCKTEFDVTATLREMGHDVLVVPVSSDLAVIGQAAEAHKATLAFNLLEEFAGVGVFDAHVAAYLEAIRLPYTGCNPRGLMLAHNKALSKMICRYHRLPVPRFHVFAMDMPKRQIRLPKAMSYPVIVKSLTEEGSVGIAQKSVCHDDQQLAARVHMVHENQATDAIVEAYIEGRELYVGVVGNRRLTVMPTWEVDFSGLRPGAPRIATGRLKWDEKYQQQIKLATGQAENLPGDLAAQLPRYAKRIFKALQLSGYARLDFRLDSDGHVYLLEANPNPQLAYGEDFAESAEAGGMPYEKLLSRIIHLGRSYRLVGQA